MNWLGDALYGLGRFFRGLFTGDPERKRRVPYERELEQAEREANDEAREKLKERFR